MFLCRKPEEFDLDLDADYNVIGPPPSFQSQIKYNLEEAVIRQRDFYYQVSLKSLYSLSRR